MNKQLARLKKDLAALRQRAFDEKRFGTAEGYADAMERVRATEREIHRLSTPPFSTETANPLNP